MKTNEDEQEEEIQRKEIAGIKILFPDDTLRRYEGLDLDTHPQIEYIVGEELGKKVTREGEPAHIKLAKKLEIAEHEPVADAGCLRFYPRGAFMKEIIRRCAWKTFVTDFGAYPIESPLIISTEDRGVKWLVESFLQRTYQVGGNNEDMKQLLGGLRKDLIKA
ncbi:MAG: hypothetical protein GWN86_29870 [Desulfobacterales bacterium]|nr:hypothetical protein [Desulfobacterales bacterium]